MEEKVLGWHFVRDNGRTANGDIAVRAGTTYSTDEIPVLCSRGFHASERILDALKYAPGSMVCRVELWGNVQRGIDKLVAQNRRVLWMINIDRELHEFACELAEETLTTYGVTDPRCWDAIATKRRWLDGKATDEELTDARNAAWEAASVVARAAARAAAWDVARDAVWAVAWTAAWADFNARLEARVLQLARGNT